MINDSVHVHVSDSVVFKQNHIFDARGSVHPQVTVLFPSSRRISSAGGNVVVSESGNKVSGFTVKQGDTSPAIEVTLKDLNGDVINLAGASVRFHMSTKGLKALVDEQATLVDAPNGRVKYVWSPGDTDVAGEHFAEWEITYSDGSTETFPSAKYIRVQVLQQIA